MAEVAATSTTALIRELLWRVWDRLTIKRVIATGMIALLPLVVAGCGSSSAGNDDNKFLAIAQKLYPHEDAGTLLQAAHWVCDKMSHGSLSGVLAGNIRDNDWDSSEIAEHPGEIYGEGNAEDFVYQSVRVYCPQYKYWQDF